MKPLLPAVLLGLMLAPVALRADTVLLEYYTTLSTADTYNSRGQPLDDVCGIVQQDRANVHRFGNPDGDPVDHFFVTPERRAMIAGRCVYDPGHHTVARIRNRVIGFVRVVVLGRDGYVTQVQVFEGAG